MPIDETLVGGEDVIMNDEILDLGYKLLYVPDVLVYHYRRPNIKSWWKSMYRYGMGRVILPRHRKGEVSLLHIITGWSVPIFLVIVIILASINIWMLLWIVVALFMAVFGIEVASDDELRKLAKGITVDQIFKTIEILRTNDIAIVGDIMIGFDYDNEAIIKKRFEFADQVDPDVMWVGYLTPPPGSPIWADGIKRGWIDPDHLDMLKWDFLHPVVPTNHLSIEDLGRLGAWGMREFYSKPGRIQRILESNFDELGKLCFKDVMAGVGKWEAGAVKGEKHI